MKTKNLISSLSLACGLCFTFSANALFHVDYQGMSPAELNGQPEYPDGYRLLVDKSQAIVHEVGQPYQIITTSFGADIGIQEAAIGFLPEGWMAFIDEKLENPENVSWYAEKTSLIEVLRDISANHSYQFVVDYDQKLIQITDNKYFKPDHFNHPVELYEPNNDQNVFLYTHDPKSEEGVLLIGGESYIVDVEKTGGIVTAKEKAVE